MKLRRPLLLGAAFFAAGSAALAQNPFSEWDLFRQLVMIPGISGQETKVMDFIQADLPKSLKVQRDAKNDMWFTVGSGRPHILFVAHADELGFTVDKITPQGLVRLKGRPGFLPQACEARPFVIYTAKGPVEGIMVPRPDFDAAKPQPYAPDTYEMDLGPETEAEVRALGVAEGNPVIFKKHIVDLAPGRLRRSPGRRPADGLGRAEGPDRHLRLERRGRDRSERGRGPGHGPQARLCLRHRHLRIFGRPARKQALRRRQAGVRSGSAGPGQQQPGAQDRAQ
jgi:hypothetical protein